MIDDGKSNDTGEKEEKVGGAASKRNKTSMTTRMVQLREILKLPQC